MNRCIIPTPKVDVNWQRMHNHFVQEARQSKPEVVFIGDSIIEQMQSRTIWKEKINSLHCVNFGIGGDRVENVLWRIQNGEFDFTAKIQAVVLFVGTNNYDCTPYEIFEGILKIVEVIREKLDHSTAIIIPTLLPKGRYPNKYRENNAKVNIYLMEKFANEANTDDGTNTNIHIVSIDKNIIQSDRTISHHIMYDYLHLTDLGYTRIFEPVYNKLCEVLKK